MQIMTYNEILTYLCDHFDSLISPKTIARTNNNIIYLMFKAMAKGFEVINNVCVAVKNKFDPANCEVEDLDSVALLVGTERHEGSATGLYIIITNNDTVTLTLIAGMYYYKLDDDTTFYFEITENTAINAGEFITIIAMSENRGSYPVTAQEEITVESEVSIPKKISFSCLDNNGLLGTKAETDLEFRKRILTKTDSQDAISELQETLRGLPYLFDCRCKFNNTASIIDYDGYAIPPKTLAIFYNGMPRNEIAEVVASKSIYPTLQTDNSKELRYYNDIFAEGYYPIHIIPFQETLFSVNVIYKIDTQFSEPSEVEEIIRKKLLVAFTGTEHKDYIKEDDVYNVVEELNISGVDFLGVDLKSGEDVVNYIEVPLSRIPKIENITFTQR